MKFRDSEIKLLYREIEQIHEERELIKSSKDLFHSINNLNGSDKQNVNYNSIFNIDIKEISQSQPISKSNFLLSIIEIGNSPQHYYPQFTNPYSKYFWYKITKYNEFVKLIFVNYPPSLVKSLWVRLKSLKNLIYLSSIIQQNQDMINTSPVNLNEILSCIETSISLCNKNVNETNDILHQEITKIINEKANFLKKKNNVNSSNSIPSYATNDHNYLTKKRKLKFQNVVINGTNPQQPNTKSLALFTGDIYNSEFSQIDEIVDVLKDHFKNISKEEILFTLNSTSFNISQAYYQLSFPNISNFSFSESEDYIIKYMKNTEMYKELCKFKGEKNILERKKYLNI